MQVKIKTIEVLNALIEYKQEFGYGEEECLWSFFGLKLLNEGVEGGSFPVHSIFKVIDKKVFVLSMLKYQFAIEEQCSL